MFDKLGKKIQKIIKFSESNKIIILTNHLKIDGYVYECDEKCEDSGKCLLTLTDAVVCKLEDYCKCDEESCDCNDYVCFKYDWLHINLSEIVAFSIIK